ncbi:hypothetical protein C8R47DRAFT_1216203 [Mycena vitilis]|nr:hypothetical protein C8R47DRAFT_1216203 [Mycena vitilis]
MQIQINISALLLALATQVMQVTSVALDSDSVVHVSKRQSFNDCFNEGYETGVAAGCGAVGERTLGDVTPSFACNGGLAAAYNEGYNDGFQVGYNQCFNS